MAQVSAPLKALNVIKGFRATGDFSLTGNKKSNDPGPFGEMKKN